ncbi:hypothetical protein ACUTAF_14245 [Pseudomonas sp. SP16.1]|uniref:hypothetical protein n=1 Tax=Pseudomonas sp. SP16.1 TaxID=3458854 RepID=UPI0040464C56
MSSHRSLASPLGVLVALLLGIAASPLLAAAPADDLLRLHQLRLATQRSLGDFYMYNGMEGDQRYARTIGESLQQAQSRLDELDQMPGEGSKTLYAGLQREWQSYRDGLQMLLEAMRKQGYTDLQPVADLADHNQRLMAISAELYRKMQEESGYSVPPMTQRSREQSLLMQGIALDYASRSASVGGSFFGGGGERAIDELAGEFNSGLDKLNRARQNTPEITSDLRAITTKWRYIEKSLLNYNENTVPFLVNKYADSIIASLEGVSAQYAASQH